MSDRYSDNVVVIETNIDDSTGEVLGYTLEKLFNSGARDAFYTSIYMKKNRPAYKLTVICSPELKECMENIIFEETTAIGIRFRNEERTCLSREIKEINTCYGLLKVKVVNTGKGLRLYPEYSSAKELAEKFGVSLYDVYSQIRNLNN